MKLPTLHRKRAVELPGIVGTARLSRRSANLAKRLKPGEVAIIEHIDLDRATAEALVGAEVGAVVNAAPSISGRYPNLGPQILAQAGIPLLDNVGVDVFTTVSDGEKIRIDQDTLYRGETAVVTGSALDTDAVEAAMEEAKSGLATQLEAFAANATEYVRRERELLLDGVGVPEIGTRLKGRHVLLVVPGADDREDLAGLRTYIRDRRPVLVGVDHGADTLLAAGYRPDLIVGDMDALSDKALRSGAELVVHAYRDGRAPGQDRLERLGLECVLFRANGTSEDVALLLADAQESSLIVMAGAHATLVELLDRGRAGMASTFMTRLRIGGKLVDAKGVRRLYRPRTPAWHLVLVLVVAVLVVLLALAVTPVGQDWLGDGAGLWDDLVAWGRGVWP